MGNTNAGYSPSRLIVPIYVAERAALSRNRRMAGRCAATDTVRFSPASHRLTGLTLPARPRTALRPFVLRRALDPRGTQTNLLNGRRDNARPRCRAAASTRSGISARMMALSRLRVPFNELAGPVHHRIVRNRRLLPPARRPPVLDDRVRPHHSGEPVQPPLASTSDGVAPGFAEAIWFETSGQALDLGRIVVACFRFGGRHVADRFEQPVGIVAFATSVPMMAPAHPQWYSTPPLVPVPAHALLSGRCCVVNLVSRVDDVG